jgi:hypothetical protein
MKEARDFLGPHELVKHQLPEVAVCSGFVRSRGTLIIVTLNSPQLPNNLEPWLGDP